MATISSIVSIRFQHLVSIGNLMVKSIDNNISLKKR